MLMRCTVSVGRMGGKAVNSCTAVHRNRIHPTPVPVWAGGGDAQPTKWVTSSLVVTLKRGAPAPQCEPLGSPNKSGFRRSYPSMRSFAALQNESATLDRSTQKQ